MENSYIRDYMCNLLEDTYNDDLERLKALFYGLDYILNNIQYNLENANDIYNYNKLTTCYIVIKEIIQDSEKDFEV
jgi:hypothetical protein